MASTFRVLFLGALLCTVVVAQSVSSSLDGTVVDVTRAAVPSAEVVLTNLDTGATIKTATDAAGNYAFPSIPSGTYRLTVSHEGFSAYELSQFRIEGAQHTTQDVVLKVGQVAESLTVNGGGLSNLLETTANDLGTLVERQSVSELPLNGRNYLQLALISGAAQVSGTQSIANQYQGAGRGMLTINVGANESDFTMYLIDGMQTVASRAGNMAIGLSLGAIDQFQLHYGFFLPDLGPDPGVVDVLTKSGTNHIHGEAYEYLRNNDMDARSYFSATPPGPYKRNQFGGDVGGPIRHDKLFFFANYEGLRQVLSNFAGAFTPTQAMFGGDFSALSTPIYDPRTLDKSTGKRQPFLGNIIPPSSINSVTRALLQYYIPGSSYSIRPFNITGNPRSTLSYDQVLARIDANLNGRNQLFTEFSYYNSPATNATLFPLAGLSYPMDAEMGVVGLTSTLSSSKVNEMRIGFVRNSVYQLGQTVPGIQDKIGFTGSADHDGVPHMILTGIGGFGQEAGRLGNIDDSYQVHDSFSWLHGTHMIKFGGDLNYIRSVQDSANAHSRGSATFQATYSTQLNTNAQGQLVAAPNTGNAFADYLLGMPTAGFTGSMPHTHVRWTNFQPYIEDTWKIRPGLTVNTGLAYFITTPPRPVDTEALNANSFDFRTGQILYAALGDIPPGNYALSTKNFAPRVGLAWEPAFAKGTVIRAGWGIYYGQQNFFDSQYYLSGPGIAINTSVSNAQPLPTYTMGVNMLPPTTLQPITREFAQSVTGFFSFVPQHNPTPYVSQWNFDVQHSFGRRYLLDIAYTGSEGHHLQSFFNANDCFDPTTNRCTIPNPYPRFPYIQEVANVGNSATNALLAKFRRQFSGGLSLLANYTWSKTITASSQGGNGITNQNGNCRQCDRGRALYNVPQSLALSAVWDIPVGRGGKLLESAGPLLNAAVGGWGIDFIASFKQGMPFTVTAPNVTSFLARAVRANRFCNGRDSLQNQDLRSNGMLYFDTSCFAAPPAGTLGNSGSAILIGPGTNNWDITVHKDFPVRETMRIQIRGELFNAFNHAQFANPDSGVASINYGHVIALRQDPREIQVAMRLIF